MKKRLFSLFITIVLVGTLFGCGTKNNNTDTSAGREAGNDSESSTDTVSKDNTSAATNGEERTLKLVFWGTDTEKKNIQEEVIPAFEAANPGIRVESQHINSGDCAAIATMLASGNPPDVCWIDPSYIPGWASEGVLYDLYELMENDSNPTVTKEDYLDYAFLEYEPDKAYGTILSCEPLILYYNPDVFDEAGVEYPSADPDKPWTWDQVLEAAKKLTIDINGNTAASSDFDSTQIARYGLMFDSWHYQFDGVLNSFGGSWLAEDGSFGLTSDESIEALQYLGDLVNVHHVAPSPLQFTNLPSMDVCLLSGQTAMTLSGAWDMLTFSEQGKKGQYDMAAFPTSGRGDNPTTVGLMALIAFKTENNSDDTWQLFKWLNNTEGALSQYTKGCWMPLLKEYYEDEAKSALWLDNEVHTENFKNAVMKPTLNNAVITPNFNVKNFSDLSAVVGPAMQKVYNGEASAQEVIAEIENAANALCDGYYFE